MEFDSPRVISVSLTREELRLVLASIVNAQEFIEDWEYPTVVGFEKSEATVLAARLHSIYTDTAPS